LRHYFILVDAANRAGKGFFRNNTLKALLTAKRKCIKKTLAAQLVSSRKTKNVPAVPS